ncbi:hypothetical protein QWY31_16315 [Cytophagales bacterium LB-30]|uniref:Peptidase S74 domain-containing protein n=1 Tax=Shiella aurantiaca TaxID=3058365 RepID=A0ABT8FAS0_9BACT|nr:hypothetical protein [Shiella aurantiaca]MDN4167076.1 hypothetical protein [Shiella aurantiaca]
MKKSLTYIVSLLCLSYISHAQTQIASSPFFYNSAGETSIGIAPSGATLMIKQLTDTQSGGLRIRNANNQSSFFWMDAANVMHIENAANGSRDFVFNENGTGRVGIGIQPSAALHVLQATGAGPFTIIEGGGAVAENTSLRLYDRGTASGNINHLEFAFNGGAGGAAVTTRLRARNHGNYAANGGSFYLETAYNNTGGFNDNQLALISNGNVGIGTAAPQQKLHLNGNFMIDGSLMRDETDKFIYVAEQTNGLDFESVSQVKIGPYLTLGNFGEGNRSWIGNNAILNYSAWGEDAPNGSGNRFIPAHAPGKALVMQIDYSSAQLQGKTYAWNGSTSEVDLNSFTNSWILGPDFNYFASKVSIGDTYKSGDHMLYVKGSILAEEVQVKLRAQWPDYVFEQDYPLMSLSEIEKYIQANKHLPEVPSAKEMEQNGVKLLEMNMLLLKKVEELTLHVISLEKEVQTLKSKE